MSTVLAYFHGKKSEIIASNRLINFNESMQVYLFLDQLFIF